MSMLGASVLRKRVRETRRAEARAIESGLTFEQVKIGCELALLFMLWHHPRPSHLRESGPSWFMICTKEMVKYPEDGYRYLWWWALRHLGEPKEGKTLAEEIVGCHSYLEWKFEQVNRRSIRANETKL